MDRELARKGSYVACLTQKLIAEYKVSGVTIHITRSKMSQVVPKPDGFHIKFGWNSIRRAYTDGFKEYDTICFATQGRHITNPDEGVHQLVLHEFAHIIVSLAGARKYRSVHNETFVTVLRNLMTKYPCQQCLEWYDDEGYKLTPPYLKEYA